MDKKLMILGVLVGIMCFAGMARADTDPTGGVWSTSFVPTQDLMVGTGSKLYTNQNTLTNLFVMYRTQATAIQYRTYLEYNISALSNSSDITAAKICWNRINWNYNQATDNMVFGAFHVYSGEGTVRWNETTMTYFNQVCGQNMQNTTACNNTAENTTNSTGAGADGCLSVLGMLQQSVSESDDYLSVAFVPLQITGLQEGFGMNNKECSGASNTTDCPLNPVKLYINCTSGCAGIGENATATTTTVPADYTPEANWNIIEGWMSYIGGSLGLTGTTAVVGGKFLVWVVAEIIIVVVICIYLAKYHVQIDLNFISIALLLLLGVGVIFDWVPGWIGVVMIVLAALLVVQKVQSYTGGGGS